MAVSLNLCGFFLLLSAYVVPAHELCAQVGKPGLPDTPSESLEQHRNDPGAEREISWRSLPKDFLHDQKDIWLFPMQLAKGRHWLPTIAIVGGTAGHIVADSHAMPYFQT